MENSEGLASEAYSEGFVFPRAEAYLREQFLQLSNDYSKDGKYVESCSLIAVDVAKLILEDGGSPQLLAIRGKIIKTDAYIANETLVPRRYKGRVKWGGHTVCECKDIIYDPMVGSPLDRSTYLRDTFQNEVEAKVLVPPEEMAVFVRR